MLAAAVELADYPAIRAAPLHAGARSVSCGSSLEIDIVATPDGRIDRIGMCVRACAVGQAAAAVFARHAAGLSSTDIGAAHDQITAWLAGTGPMPDWPDLALIAPARDFRGRHGAIALPWKAALAALSSSPATR